MAKQLLVVDDDPGLLLAVSDTLRAEGYEVVTARRGSEALVRVAEALPDLIISDIRMPGMDGYAFARQLRNTPRTALIPIVFLTAMSETESRIEGFRTGVDMYLTKPFEPEELLAVIKAILTRIERTHAEIAKTMGNVTDRFVVQDEDLTESEARIAAAVARGLSNKEIAAELQLSVRTVENHISHILDKKHFTNRVEIARFVLQQARN